MYTHSNYPNRENGLTLEKHALLLFISVVVSFILHFCFALFYDIIVEDQVVANKNEKKMDKDGNPDALMRIFHSIDIEGTTAQDDQGIHPDSQKAAETTDAHVRADDINAQMLQTPDIPERPQLPDSLGENNLSIPNTYIPEFTPPQVVALTPEDIELPQGDHKEPKWSTDLIDHDNIKSDVTFSKPIFEESYINTTIDSELFTLPTKSQIKSVATEQANSTTLRQLEKEGSHQTMLEKDIDPVATILPPTELPKTNTNEAIEQAVHDLPSISSDGVQGSRKFIPIDKSLSLALKLYTTPEDPTHNYYQIDIVRRPESQLPLMQKDVVFIQDVSGSIGRRRMEACKVALKSALYHTLRDGDRFTIFAFRDFTLTPAASWMTFNSSTRETTDTFIDSLRARGNTDIFSLLSQDLPTLERQPDRPLIAIIITDGEATAGVTETAKIIGEFTRLNRGNIAIYTFNAKRFDPYFLDMLCYSNRGENISSSGDADKVAEELQPIFDKIRNPVMKDVSLIFDTQSASQIHPKNLTHLFADRYLTVYGRVPKSVQEVSCQLKGRAKDRNYDAVFRFSLENATMTTEDLRAQWAKRAMFDMLAEYASNPSEALLQKIEAFSQKYNVKNPYKSVPTKK